MAIHSIAAMAERIELWPVDRLQPYAKNARTHSDDQVDQIAASIREFGFTNPILVDSRDGIIAGHGRLLAAKRLQLPTVPVIVLDHLSDAQRRAYILADNKLALNAGWDDALLAEELAALQDDGFDLALTGFSDEELSDLMPEVEEVEPAGEEDAVPEVPEDPVTKPGDVWVMGKHRLMCGDSTSGDAVAALMSHETADVVVFDPPYEVESLYSDAMPVASETQKLIVFWDFKRFAIGPHCAINAGWNPLYEFIWDNVTSWYTPNRPLARHKACGVFGDDPKWNFDDAIIHDGKKRVAKVVENTRGVSNYKPLDGAVHIRTVEAFPTTAESGGHAHSKPIPWLEAIFNGVGGDTYLDLFGGSGSTLIACEKTRRTARLMELDPKYCDVIVRRWQDYTGKKAMLEQDNRTFDDHAADRIAA